MGIAGIVGTVGIVGIAGSVGGFTTTDSGFGNGGIIGGAITTGCGIGGGVIVGTLTGGAGSGAATGAGVAVPTPLAPDINFDSLGGLTLGSSGRGRGCEIGCCCGLKDGCGTGGSGCVITGTFCRSTGVVRARP
jgi:hypothetical protein